MARVLTPDQHMAQLDYLPEIISAERHAWLGFAKYA